MNKSEWHWPDSLDAVVAASKHHKILLENNQVRVLDTCIAPGEITPVHTHRWPAVYYIKSWSDFVRRDDKENVMLDSRESQELSTVPSILWSEPLPPHSVENVGQAEICLISVELKRGIVE